MTEQTRGRAPLCEAVWKRFEADQARRERTRLIRNGTIVPSVRMKPQLLIRDGDRWVPQIVGVS